MEKQIIDFKNNEYHKAKKEVENKLQQWYNVENEVEKLITIPNTKKQYDLFLNTPLQYVKQTLDDLHRPNFNGLPISAEKLLSMLEIDLKPLEKAIEEFKKYNGKLTFVVGSGVSTILKREDFEVYTENENQLKQYKALKNLVNVAKTIFDEGVLPTHNLHHLAKFTNNKLYLKNGDLEPNPYYLQQIK